MAFVSVDASALGLSLLPVHISEQMNSMNIGIGLPLSLNAPHALTRTHTTCIPKKQSITVRKTYSKSSEPKHLQNRTANYHPPVWDHPHIQALATPYTYQRFSSQLEKLKRQAKHCLISENDNLRQLELIDALQRLGVAYHFEKEIKHLLDLTYLAQNYDYEDPDAYSTSLSFRLLRHNHYPVQSVLYGDDILEEAKSCNSQSFETLNGPAISGQETQEVQCSMHTSLVYCGMLRLEAMNFIRHYGKYDKKNLVFLELAKLDFNLVQSIHQKELIDLSRWWEDLNFKDNLHFSRDRLVENFTWAVGITHEPQFSRCRIGLTKFICILSAIDDIYDIYGSLEELELFTEAVSRWDIHEMEKLPKYMKLSYLAMFNFANETCYDVLKDQGINVLPYIAKEWESLCKSYLVEARWSKDKYTPKFDEYLKNAWISVGGPAAMMHSYILQGKTITTDTLDCLRHGQELGYWASVITRLSNDLGTSEAEMMRGDVAKSVQCYMNETGLSMEEAKKYIKELRRTYWKNLNEECVRSVLPKSIINLALNMARTSQCIYQHVDGILDGTTTNLAVPLFTEPV